MILPFAPSISSLRLRVNPFLLIQRIRVSFGEVGSREGAKDKEGAKVFGSLRRFGVGYAR